MKSHRKYFLNLSDKTHVRIKIHQEFYHCIVYTAEERPRIRIGFNNNNRV